MSICIKVGEARQGAGAGGCYTFVQARRKKEKVADFIPHHHPHGIQYIVEAIVHRVVTAPPNVRPHGLHCLGPEQVDPERDCNTYGGERVVV